MTRRSRWIRFASGRRLAALAAGALALAVMVALAEHALDSQTRPELPSGEAFSGAAPWRTDFSRRIVPREQINRAGPARDAIPALDDPRFVPAGAAPLADREPVIVLERSGQARAYPIAIMLWHEIVNHTLAGEPVVVTYCPLCNTAMAFSRRVGDRVLSFGATGDLRAANLIMYDRQTESWWQQFTGQAIVGAQSGRRLRRLPTRLTDLGRFREEFADGRVLSLATGHERPYGSNPFPNYDGSGDLPLQLPRDLRPDPRLPAKARVVAVLEGAAATVVTLPALRRRRVLNDRVGSRPIVVWWRPGGVAALDDYSTERGRDVGSVSTFDRRSGRRTLRFVERAGALVDVQTRSRWGPDGHARGGPLRGRRLEPVVHDSPFWFAAASFLDSPRIIAR